MWPIFQDNLNKLVLQVFVWHPSTASTTTPNAWKTTPTTFESQESQHYHLTMRAKLVKTDGQQQNCSLPVCGRDHRTGNQLLEPVSRFRPSANQSAEIEMHVQQDDGEMLPVQNLMHSATRWHRSINCQFLMKIHNWMPYVVYQLPTCMGRW